MATINNIFGINTLLYFTSIHVLFISFNVVTGQAGTRYD